MRNKASIGIGILIGAYLGIFTDFSLKETLSGIIILGLISLAGFYIITRFIDAFENSHWYTSRLEALREKQRKRKLSGIK